jgi:hypothetical protein
LKNSIDTIRDPTIIERIKKVSDFDSLGLKDKAHRFHAKLTTVLKGQGDSLTPEVFSDYMYKINSKIKKQKKIVLVTEQSFYCLSSQRLRIEARIPLSKINRVSLIKNSSALMQVNYLEN